MLSRFKSLGVASLVAIIAGCGTGPTGSPAADSTDAAVTESGGSAAKGAAETTVVEFNAGGLPTLAVSVPEIHCEGCAASVSSLLAGVEGVQDVTVDVDTKVATVAINEETFDAEAAVSVLNDGAFPGSAVVEGEAAAAEAG
ncbi:MAG: heavy-metal-associated domain-containing protein [Planctomycetota bacterium]